MRRLRRHPLGLRLATEPRRCGRRSPGGRRVTLGRAPAWMVCLGYWREVAMQGWRPVEDVCVGSSRTGGDGQRGAQRPGALRPDPGGGGAHDPGGARPGSGGWPWRRCRTGLVTAGSHPGRAPTPRATWRSRRCGGDRHRAGPGLDPVGVRGRHRFTPDTDQNHLRSMEFTNWREREQAPTCAIWWTRRRAAAGLVRQRTRRVPDWVPMAGTSARCRASTRSSSTRRDRGLRRRRPAVGTGAAGVPE